MPSHFTAHNISEYLSGSSAHIYMCNSLNIEHKSYSHPKKVGWSKKLISPLSQGGKALSGLLISDAFFYTLK